MSSRLQQFREEKNGLEQRFKAILDSTNAKEFDRYTDLERLYITRQMVVMQDYLRVLDARIALLKEDY